MEDVWRLLSPENAEKVNKETVLGLDSETLVKVATAINKPNIKHDEL